MDLVIAAGQAEVTVGWFEGPDLRGHWRLATDPARTADEYGLMLRQLLAGIEVPHTDVRSATIGSVLPAVTGLLEGACRRFVDVPARVVTPQTPLPIRLDVDDARVLDVYRIACAVAAHRLYRRDCVVVNLGAATSFTCVSGDGAFVGGAVAPGACVAADALFTRVGESFDGTLRAPERVIGRTSLDSVRSGVFYAAVDVVDGLARRIREEWGRPDALVIATGRLADAVGPHCRLIAAVEPYLALHGLKYIHDHNFTAAGRIVLPVAEVARG